MHDYLIALINVTISVHAYVRYFRFIRQGLYISNKHVPSPSKLPSPTTHCQTASLTPSRGTPANIRIYLLIFVETKISGLLLPLIVWVYLHSHFSGGLRKTFLPQGCVSAVQGHPRLLARDSIYAIARYMPSPVRLSVRLSVTRVDQSKTVEVRITQPSPQSSPMTLVS